MSLRYKGAILSTVGPTSAASGEWTARQQMQMQGAGVWPMPPGAPTIGTATAGDTTASVGFTAPSYTGYPAGITSYTVTSSPGGLTGTGAASPITVSGLTNGTAYTFTVTATNATGTGPASAASNSVTPSYSYIEDVFSTYLTTGAGSNITVVNGIDLAGKGGLVWNKTRSTIGYHTLFDTVRGVNKAIYSNDTSAQATSSNWLPSFNNDGFVIGTDNNLTTSGTTGVSWTFREQPKFFDVVTYTGNGAVRNIAHSLGSVPGCIMVKRTDTTASWVVYHRSIGSSNYLNLNNTSASSAGSYFDSTDPTSTVFTVSGGTLVNASGGTYVAYIFAHDAGGFGLTGTDNVISCGSFTGTGALQSINLGYEPQWLLVKQSSGSGGNWVLVDTMRGDSLTGQQFLYSNTSGAEVATSSWFYPEATGFNTGTSANSGATYIYIAIRRGPMKVPTDATKVFEPYNYAGTGSGTGTVLNAGSSTLQASDLFVVGSNNTPYNKWMWGDRLRGAEALNSSSTEAGNGPSDPQVQGATFSTADQKGFFYRQDYLSYTGRNYQTYKFKRAPSFFDEVCYTGTDAARTITHNLTVAPELIIIKDRSVARNWYVYVSGVGNTKYLNLNNTDAPTADSTVWNNTSPTSSVFSLGSSSGPNGLGETFVAYLFATCAGVSKVGSYTGTGTTQTIDCGFSGGARLVLVKRTDSTGDWYVWDTARGMVSGTDPSLLLNSTAAEVNANSIYTTTGGFQIVSTAAGINASGGSYIFLAVA